MKRFLFLLLVMPAIAEAQNYPAKPVRLIAASSPGSAVDIVSRVIAQKLSEQIGQQVVVDNRAGAGGNLGAELAAKAAPDGYTVFMATPAQAINTGLYRKLDYDLVRDFLPVSQLTVGHYCVAVHPSLPVQSVKELIALARTRRGQLNYASAGNGNATHLAGELFTSMAKIELVHVPYKGSGPGLTRPDRRPGADHVSESHRGHSLRQGEAPACAGGQRREALGHHACAADGQRSGTSGLSRHFMVRAADAGRRGTGDSYTPAARTGGDHACN